MNKNSCIGLALVAVSVVSAVALVGSDAAALKGLLGKASWYLPYVALVFGVRKLSLGGRSRLRG